MHWFFKFLLALIFSISLILSITHGLPKLLDVQKIANSEIKGFIFNDQIWEGEIRITGDILAMPGTKIQIRPGSKILVSPIGDKSNLDFAPWHTRDGINILEEFHGVYKNEPFWNEKEKIQVHFGRVEAIGTQDLPIIIRSDTQYPSPYDFNVISSRYAVFSHVTMSNYRRFEIRGNSVITDSEFDRVGECALCVNGGSVVISKNIFKESYRESIWVDSGSPRISDNVFINLKGKGVVLDPKQIGSPVISYNNFEMPTQDVLVILTGGERNPGDISYNNFSGNSVIKLACDSRIKISQNSILSIVSFIGSGCGGEYSFGPNFWGTMDARAVLQERITNKDRNFKVLIPTLLVNPPKEVGKRL